MSDTPATRLIAAAKKMLADTDANAPLIDSPVWEQALPNALSDLARFKPRRKRIDVNFVAGEDTIELPVDFIDFDLADFNRALRPHRFEVSLRGTMYGFEWLSAASSYMSSNAAGVYSSGATLFDPGTVYQLIETDEGRAMWVTPAPLATLTIKTLYLAPHVVRDENAEANPPVSAINTVPAEVEDVLLSRMCFHALLGLASLIAGDEKISAQVLTLAEKFDKQYEKRTAFAPYGRRA